MEGGFLCKLVFRMDATTPLTAQNLIESQSHRSQEEQFGHVFSEWKGSGSKSIVHEARSYTKLANLKDYEEL